MNLFGYSFPTITQQIYTDTSLLSKGSIFRIREMSLHVFDICEDPICARQIVKSRCSFFLLSHDERKKLEIESIITMSFSIPSD